MPVIACGKAGLRQGKQHPLLEEKLVGEDMVREGARLGPVQHPVCITRLAHHWATV